MRQAEIAGDNIETAFGEGEAFGITHHEVDVGIELLGKMDHRFCDVHSSCHRAPASSVAGQVARSRRDVEHAGAATDAGNIEQMRSSRAKEVANSTVTFSTIRRPYRSQSVSGPARPFAGRFQECAARPRNVSGQALRRVIQSRTGRRHGERDEVTQGIGIDLW